MRTLSLLAALLAVTTLGWAARAIPDWLVLEVPLLTAAVILYDDPKWTLALPEYLDRY